MKKYIIKDVIKDTENVEKTLIYYMGADGYVHSDIDFCEGYKRKGSAQRYIKNHVLTTWDRFKYVSQNQVLEANKWLHTYEIIEVEQ